MLLDFRSFRRRSKKSPQEFTKFSGVHVAEEALQGLEDDCILVGYSYDFGF